MRVRLVGPAGDAALRVRVAYDAHTAGSYRDTRGGGTPLATGATPHRFDLAVDGTRPVLAECLPGLGSVPTRLR